MFRSPLTDALVVIVIVLLFVGPKKLPALGRGLGDGMREFKDGITGDHRDETEPQVTLRPPSSPDAPPASPTASGRPAGSEPRRR